MFAYSRSKGLFAGVSLDGSVVTMDDDANKDVYGKAVSGEDILLNGAVSTNDVMRPFIAALEKYSPSRRPRTSTQD